MSRATVELDFFGMEKESSGKTQFQRLFDRQRSLRGIQSAISKIDPEVLKTVIASGSAAQISNGNSSENGNIFTSSSTKAFSVSSTPRGDQYSSHSLPLHSLIPGHSPDNAGETAPMTIFYNGTVSVFDLPTDKAESIFKLVEEGSSRPVVKPADSKPALSSVEQQQLLDSDGDLPIARRKSLRRFLEKRKERLTPISPYACHATEYAFLEQKPTKELL